jgi:hypothetical protein
MAVSKINGGTVFDKIDQYFAQKKDSEASMLYFVVVLLIAFLVYQFVFLQTDRDLKNTENQFRSIKQKVANNQNYLNVNSDAKLQSFKNSVEHKAKELDDTMYKISYVDNTLTELSYLLFDNKSWASFVDDISKIAKKYSVEIKEIANKFYDPTYQKISHVVEVDVKSKANFPNMVKFLNEIEESKLVIDVSDLNITKPDDKLEGNFKIAVWGMKY